MYRDHAYYAPTIEIIEVIVEEGICQSGGGTGFVFDEEEF